MVTALGILAVIAMLVGGIWLIVVAFKEHVLWGLGVLFVPFVSLIFVIMHWRDAYKPFLVNLAGAVVFFAVGWGQIMMQMGPVMDSVGQDMQQTQNLPQQFEQRIQQQTQRHMDQMNRELDRMENRRADSSEPTSTDVRPQASELARAEPQTSRPAPKPRPVRVPVYRPVSLNEAVEQVGSEMKIIGIDGVERRGILKAVKDTTLVFEKHLHGGVMTFHMQRGDIEQLEVLGWQAR